MQNWFAKIPKLSAVETNTKESPIETSEIILFARSTNNNYPNPNCWTNIFFLKFQVHCTMDKHLCQLSTKDHANF